MNQSATLAVVGGDVRQAYLASLLRADGLQKILLKLTFLIRRNHSLQII